MNDLFVKRRKAARLIAFLRERGPIWKAGSDMYHLNKRKQREHFPVDFTLEDMNKLIREVSSTIDNQVYVFFKEGFEQDYFVFGAVFPPDSYKGYLDSTAGYQYIGTIKEVLQHG